MSQSNDRRKTSGPPFRREPFHEAADIAVLRLQLGESPGVGERLERVALLEGVADLCAERVAVVRMAGQRCRAPRVVPQGFAQDLLAVGVPAGSAIEIGEVDRRGAERPLQRPSLVR